MGLSISVQEKRNFILGGATIAVIQADRGWAKLVVSAPEDVIILRKSERCLIFDVLKTLRCYEDKKSVDEAIDLLTEFIAKNYSESENV